MAQRIQTVVLALLIGAGCNPDPGPQYRGNDGRTGEFHDPGVVELDQIVWKHRASSALSGPAALTSDAAYIVSTDGRVAALELSDGTPRWTYDLETPAHGPPVATGRRLLVGTDAGLVAVGIDGTEQWRHKGAPIESAPVVVDAVAYVGDIDGNLLAVDAVGGTLIWRAVTAGPIYASPVFAGGNIIAGSGDGGVYAIDPATGEPQWAWNGSTAVRGLSASSGRLFVSAGSEVIAIELDEAEASAWRTDVGAVVETPPSLSGGMVVVGTGTGTLTGLDTTDGSQLFQTQLDAGVRGDIIVTGDRLAVPTTSRGIEVVDRAGKALWTFRTDGRAVAVTPMKTRLYVTDAAGSVYALE